MSDAKERRKIKQLISDGKIDEGLALADKTDIQFLFDITSLFWKRGERKTVEKILTRATELAPDNAVAWLNKGLISQTLGSRKKALACYDEAVRVDPQNDKVWYSAGVGLKILGEYEKALACFDEALKLNPRNDQAQSARRLAMREKHEKDSRTQ